MDNISFDKLNAAQRRKDIKFYHNQFTGGVECVEIAGILYRSGDMICVYYGDLDSGIDITPAGDPFLDIQQLLIVKIVTVDKYEDKLLPLKVESVKGHIHYNGGPEYWVSSSSVRGHYNV